MLFPINSQQIIEPHPKGLLYTRRSTIGMLGMAGTSLISTILPTSAFTFRKPANPEVNYEDLPEEWMHKQSSNLHNYIDYLRNLNLEKIPVHKVIAAHAKNRSGVWNTLPPQEMWKNISNTLRVVDRIGKELKMPVKEIASVYRAPQYNAQCPGAKKKSWHQANVAIDVIFPVDPSVVHRTSRQLRATGYFSGGIGNYSNFTHVDTRGQNVDW
jgi:uncharacterized protein YcbK (DUF882 family)